MSDGMLFDIDPGPVQAKQQGEWLGEPRLRRPNRGQVLMQTFALDALVAPGHRVRMVWRFVEGLDLTKLLKPIKSREGGPGHPAIDPRVPLALWLYATHKGIASARELERLCSEHDVYRWICGGVSVNYHSLSDFRSEQGEAFGEVLEQLLAALMHGGVLKVKRIAIDGLRVRASAGAASFRREPTLRECLDEAGERVARAAKRSKDPRRHRRKAAAQERAARNRLDRVARALEELPKVREAKKSPKKKAEARVSTTDPEARVMHMPDGGFRPAHNIQVATDTESRYVVGVLSTNCGSDAGGLIPMLGEVKQRTTTRPDEALVDGGFVNREAFQQAADQGVTVLAPVPAPKREGVDPHAPKSSDSEAVAAWRERMATDQAKEVYKERSSTAETVNAAFGKQGLTDLNVRGSEKVLAVGLLSAVTYNIFWAFSTGFLT